LSTGIRCIKIIFLREKILIEKKKQLHVIVKPIGSSQSTVLFELQYLDFSKLSVFRRYVIKPPSASTRFSIARMTYKGTGSQLFVVIIKSDFPLFETTFVRLRYTREEWSGAASEVLTYYLCNSIFRIKPIWISSEADISSSESARLLNIHKHSSKRLMTLMVHGLGR